MFFFLNSLVKSNSPLDPISANCGQLVLNGNTNHDFSQISNKSKLYIQTQKFYLTERLFYQIKGSNEKVSMKADQNYTFTEDVSIIQETKLGGKSLIYYWTVPDTEKCDFAYAIINQKKVLVRDFNQNNTISRCYMFSMLGDTKITYSEPHNYSAQTNKHFYLRVPDNQNYSITVATLNQKYGAFNVSISRFDDLSVKLQDIEVTSVDNVTWWVWTLLFGTTGFIMFILTICMLRRPNPEKDYIYYWGPSQSSLTSTLLGEV